MRAVRKVAACVAAVLIGLAAMGAKGCSGSGGYWLVRGQVWVGANPPDVKTTWDKPWMQRGGSEAGGDTPIFYVKRGSKAWRALRRHDELGQDIRWIDQVEGQ